MSRNQKYSSIKTEKMFCLLVPFTQTINITIVSLASYFSLKLIQNVLNLHDVFLIQEAAYLNLDRMT